MYGIKAEVSLGIQLALLTVIFFSTVGLWYVVITTNHHRAEVARFPMCSSPDQADCLERTPGTWTDANDLRRSPFDDWGFTPLNGEEDYVGFPSYFAEKPLGRNSALTKDGKVVGFNSPDGRERIPNIGSSWAGVAGWLMAATSMTYGCGVGTYNAFHRIRNKTLPLTAQSGRVASAFSLAFGTLVTGMFIWYVWTPDWTIWVSPIVALLAIPGL